MTLEEQITYTLSVQPPEGCGLETLLTSLRNAVNAGDERSARYLNSRVIDMTREIRDEREAASARPFGFPACDWPDTITMYPSSRSAAEDGSGVETLEGEE